MRFKSKIEVDTAISVLLNESFNWGANHIKPLWYQPKINQGGTYQLNLRAMKAKL